MTAPSVPTSDAPNKINAIFQSMKESGGSATGGTSISGQTLIAFALIVVACTLMYVAIKHWHRTRTKPTAVRSHRKLLAEAARLTPGVSRRQMKTLSGLATSAGLSSPLVALICPSAISRLAGQIREDRQRVALRAVAEGLVRAQRDGERASKSRAARK